MKVNNIFKNALVVSAVLLSSLCGASNVRIMAKAEEISRYSTYTVNVNETRTYNGTVVRVYGSYDVINNSYVSNIDLSYSFSGGSGTCTFSPSGTSIYVHVVFYSGADLNFYV